MFAKISLNVHTTKFLITRPARVNVHHQQRVLHIKHSTQIHVHVNVLQTTALHVMHNFLSMDGTVVAVAVIIVQIVLQENLFVNQMTITYGMTQVVHVNFAALEILIKLLVQLKEQLMDGLNHNVIASSVLIKMFVQVNAICWAQNMVGMIQIVIAISVLIKLIV